MSGPARPRVLHVDDDPAALRAVERALTAAGFAVRSASTAAEGFAAALRGRWALLVLDVDLPDLSGFELCARLRAARVTRAIPVLHLSAARVDVRDRVRGLEGGADAYLVQPVAPEELVAVARALVTRRRTGGRAPSRGSARGHAAAADREAAVTFAAQALRGPLTAIYINASSLAATAPDPVARARATAVLEAHAAAAQGLADLGELCWLESRRVPLALERCVAAEVAAGVARRVEAAAAPAGVQIRVEVPAGLSLRCDPDRLEHALDALVRRTIRGARRGGVVTLSAASTGEHVRFSITGGEGATAEDGRALLVDEAWSTRVARSAPEQVAVALARAVVVAHGGRITVDPVSPAVDVDVPASPLPALP